MKDGTSISADKPEHAVDLDTGAVIAAELHPDDRGDTTTLAATLTAAEANLETVDKAPMADAPADLVTDKGYFGRAVLKPLEDGPWKTRIAEPKGKGISRWRGDDDARRAVYNNRARLLSGVAKAAFRLRAEIVEPCLSGYHPHPLYVGCAIKRQAGVLEWKWTFCSGMTCHFRRRFPRSNGFSLTTQLVLHTLKKLDGAMGSSALTAMRPQSVPLHQSPSSLAVPQVPSGLRPDGRDSDGTDAYAVERVVLGRLSCFQSDGRHVCNAVSASAWPFSLRDGLSDPSQAALRDGASGSGPDRRHP